MRSIETTDWRLEVDDAVKARGQDPTGGRGMNGIMNNQLAATKDGEMLQSAV